MKYITDSDYPDGPFYVVRSDDRVFIIKTFSNREDAQKHCDTLNQKKSYYEVR